MPKANGTTWELLVCGDDLATEAKTRTKENLEISDLTTRIAEYTNSGWEVKKQGVRKTTFTKAKTVGSAFEDRVWSIFFKMGFTTLNQSDQFHLEYAPNFPNLTKQIDVVAIDEETCLFVECKSAQQAGTHHSWQTDIGEIRSNFSGYIAEIHKKYPNRKCKYIFATNNYVLGDQDRDRLAEANIYYFDENTVLYYEKLVEYLGSAAKFQLLGSIFAGATITNMDASIPAIQGSMGGITYYSFLMKPSDLLKIGYVLHRTNANNDYDDLLPSYQRLIKKERLKSVREFVDNGGYFPNSLIISIDTKKRKPMRFDSLGPAAGRDGLMQAGILHLPKTYQSAYIIDGQHRLYGYADSRYADTNCIPVVAFENLDKEKQLKLFMEINENQKSVSKALRNILEIDIYYDSENASLRKKALLGKIAKHLGEDPKSPLYGRIIIGEDAATEKCCITIDYIKAALEKTAFFNRYKRNGSITSQGLFDKDDNNATMDTIYPLLRNYLTLIQTGCPEEWDSYVTKNNAIVAVIRILDDIVNIVLSKNPALVSDTSALLAAGDDFVTALICTLSDLPAEKRDDIRRLRGDQAKEDAYRTVQMTMHQQYPDFTNENIEKYYREKFTNYAVHAKREAELVISFLRAVTRTAFDGPNWKVMHMSEEHHDDFSSRMVKLSNARQRQGDFTPIDEWIELSLSDLVKIVIFSTHWSDVYKDKLAEVGYTGTKLSFVSLIRSIESIYAKTVDGKSITLSEYQQVQQISQFLLEGDNDGASIEVGGWQETITV